MNEDIIYEIVSDCQEWIINSETKEWRGAASPLVKFIIHSYRKYQWVSQEEIIEASKVLTELLGNGKMPLRDSGKFHGPSLQCRACGRPLNGKDDLCGECLRASKDTLKDMLLREGYSFNSINKYLYEE